MRPEPHVNPSRQTPGHLRVEEVVGLCLVTLAVTEVCSRVFGLRDVRSILTIAIGCASYPAQRLLQVRRFGAAAARSVDVYAAVAIAPFMLLPIAYALDPGSAIWQPTMPPMMRYIGMVLAVGSAVPRVRQHSDDASSFTRLSPPLLLTLGIVLIVSNAAVALLMLYGLATGVLGGGHALTRRVFEPITSDVAPNGSPWCAAQSATR